MSELDLDKIPRHVAIIPDGNGRWAEKQGLPRDRGYYRGTEAVKQVVRSAHDLGVEMLTLFAFSTENWARPPEEVTAIMRVFDHYLNDDPDELMRNGVRVQAIGRLEMMDPAIQDAVARLARQTEGNDEMMLTFALSYSGRTEIVDAMRRIARRVETGHLEPDAIDEKCIEANLYAPELPEPDLLIRTGREHRISNFLLWQLAYTELYMSDAMWPDFDRAALTAAIAAYQRRERRYGRTGDQIRNTT